MKPTKNDYQILEKMKKVFGELGLPLAYEDHADDHLAFASRLFGSTPVFESDTTVAYEVKIKKVIITSSPVQPIPHEKKGEIFEVFNFINDKSPHVKLIIDPETQRVHMRAEMPLFGRPLNREHFREFLTTFLTAGLKLFPMIEDFFNDKVNEEDIKKLIQEEIDHRQSQNTEL